MIKSVKNLENYETEEERKRERWNSYLRKALCIHIYKQEFTLSPSNFVARQVGDPTISRPYLDYVHAVMLGKVK